VSALVHQLLHDGLWLAKFWFVVIGGGFAVLLTPFWVADKVRARRGRVRVTAHPEGLPGPGRLRRRDAKRLVHAVEGLHRISAHRDQS